MQEVHSGYKQSLDASSKQRVRQVCSLEPEQLGTWLTYSDPQALNAGVQGLPDWP